ncbi:GNAT family N-acetyltransferase [Azohydromonas caseinilytica]|uniref:GNAT family N-acetyltransferase n=1 Tax=Azohydromonas caseinilytica TaxID=2728836 RepID=A0A848FL52_9BURK|nr:GNAT family N-acetyltransferase [Azohydromonas caseinilytica]NML18990.1 GNAT family N-acetyltransferase [Azohydromonas caseinilytica]
MTIRTIRTLEGLAEVRTSWEQWQTHVNSDLAQFELLCRLRPQVMQPCVIVVERHGVPQALVAARLEEARVAPSIGYLQLPRIPARVLAVIHQGVMGQLDDAAAAEVVQHLWSMLATKAADAIDFHHLPEDSALLRALYRDGPRWFCEKTPRWSTHREMVLPTQGGLMETLRGKHRTHLRKREKELDEAFPGRVTWRWLTRIDDVPALCAKLEKVAAGTYQRGLGAGFFDNEEFRRRFELFARRGQLRVQLLEIDDEARAFWFGFVYGHCFHSSETGYDASLRDYEVGTLMFVRMVDELAREGVRQLDFGLGDAYYKERFGHRFWRETCVWLFAPTFKGSALMVYVRLLTVAEQAARRLVSHLGLRDKLKNAWRRNRAKGGPAATAKARS